MGRYPNCIRLSVEIIIFIAVKKDKEFYLLVLGIYIYHAPVIIFFLYTDIVITRRSIYLAGKHYACYIKNKVSVSTKRQISITPTK